MQQAPDLKKQGVCDEIGRGKSMKHQNVIEAFNILINEVKTALEDVRRRAAFAAQQGNYNDAQTQLNEARKIDKFLSEICAKKQEWNALNSKPREGKLEPLPRLPRGERTPEKAYRLPILRALVQMGGEGKMSDVLDLVFEEMITQLKPIDLQPLQSDPNMPRWRNTAQWERQSMVNEGLLRKDSPRGIWAITEKGREYLRKHAG